MLTYCSVCKKSIPIIYVQTKLVKMTNKKLTRKCADRMANKSFFDEIKHKSELEIFVSQFSID